ncbi:MAG: type I-B CRISPR-associated protein Cas8b1/Cst1 [Smithella sp.]|nr:type I-B CRISPR-associated protein Cas8b1/Cst1 [Smithella sp.]
MGKNDETIRIGDEILRYIYSRTLSYNHLNQYCRISISKNIESKYFNLEKVCNVIIEYISLLKGGRMDISKSTKKGFASGKGLYEVLKGNKRENQIDGLAFQFLNDLKVQDWQKFFDRYSRLAMANNLHIAFGLDEMNDMDVFQQFGYSFVLGLVDGLNPMEKTTKEVGSNG